MARKHPDPGVPEDLHDVRPLPGEMRRRASADLRPDLFNDRRAEGRRTKPASVDELYEKHLTWAKASGHGDNPESVAALRAHEKAGGLTRTQANKVADQAYIGGGESDWRSQGHRD